MRPNILFIMSDDHACQAISCYGSIINKTPNIDRIASEGIRVDNCFCTNSICSPSRAVILTGKHNHINGVRTLNDALDGRQQTFPKLLQQTGYQTAIIGKWHLGHGENYNPTGFDYWNVLPGQGDYHNPQFIEMGNKKTYPGYATDIITDMSINWIKNRDKDRPFMLMCHHKAPHRPWEPDEKHKHLYEDIEIPEPDNFYDNYETRSDAAVDARIRIDRDLDPQDLKEEMPSGLNEIQAKKWKYQRYIKDYLRCVASIDDNIGRLLDALEKEGLEEDTIVVYTSDQGFFLGEHGWFDKRFMYEESLQMPFVVKYPREIKRNTTSNAMALNLDFASTFLDYAGVVIPKDIQGTSLRNILKGETPDTWRTSMYYRYWMGTSVHYIAPHYGIRTHQYKLICYYGPGLGPKGIMALDQEEHEWPQWELYDLIKDPKEMKNIYNAPDYKEIVNELKIELEKIKLEAGDME